MRALTIWILLGLLVTVGATFADEPRGYLCAKPDEDHQQCVCGPGEKPARDRANNAICEIVWSRLKLVAPAPGAAVDATTAFIVDVVGRDEVELQLCYDAACSDPEHTVPVTPKVRLNNSARATIELPWLPADKQMFWRARPLRRSKRGPHTEIRTFKTVPTSDPRSELSLALKKIDDGTYDPALELVRATTSAATHYTIAARLARANQCPLILRVLAWPRVPDPPVEAQLAQLQLDCDAAATNKQVVAAADAGDHDAGKTALSAFMNLHPTNMELTFWSEAYLAAKRSPPDCATARNRVILARSLSLVAADPVMAAVSDACPPEVVEPPSRKPSELAGGFANVDYEWPAAGQRTRQGLRYGLGVRGRVHPNWFLGGGVAALRPLQRGLDDRLGSTWGAFWTGDGGMLNTGASTLRFYGEAFGGRGKFFENDNQHSCLVMDVLASILFRQRISSHLYLAARAGMRVGFLVDFADQPSDSYLDRFLERWHGTMTYSAGLSLEVR